MTELHDLRLGITAVRRAADAGRIQIHDIKKRIKEIDIALGLAVTGSQEEADLQQERPRREQELADATAQLPPLVAALEKARADYAAQAAAEPALWPDAAAAPAVPLLLLPVRLEAVHQQTAGSTQLLLRVYPDDVHVDAHEEGLTDAERAAGKEYWATVGAGASAAAADEAWLLLVRRLGPARAAWTREALRPGAAEPEHRDHTWSRAAHTTLLPDRFVFSAYIDTEGGGSGLQLAWREQGEPIPDLVKIGFPPKEAGGERMDRLPWDVDTKWLVDFEDAIAKGLAIKVALPDPDVTYVLLTAVGISGNVNGATAADRWQATLQAHQYSAGLAFLPVGTPTNNTPGSRSGWRSRPGMPTPATVDAQRSAYDQRSNQAAARAAAAFGIDGARVLASVPDALDEGEEPDLRRLHAALGRYFAQSDLLRPYPPPPTDPEDPVGPTDGIQLVVDIPDVVAHYERWVRSRGTLPSLRVGNQPYGILPASALDLWQGEVTDPRLHATLSALLVPLELARQRAVQVGAGDDQDAVILDLLSRVPASMRVKDTQTRPVELMQSLHDAPSPMLVSTVADRSRADFFLLKRENESLPRGIQTDVPAPETMKTLPFTAARERFRTAEAALAADPNANVVPILEDPDPDHTVGQMGFEVVEHSYFEIAATATSIGYGALPPGAVDPQAPPPDPTDPEAGQRALFLADRARRMREVADPLIELEARAIGDPSGVDRLLLEVFDSVAHRYDAWYTSLAAARLAQIREQRPTGLRTGAYAVLTDVHDPGPIRSSDGYIMTPSMHHATTAAVLRSGYLAHSDKRALAVDLQSWRVRAALDLLDGVRTGQPVSNLLGYRFERGLHDAQLDVLIDGYRKAYPLRLAVAPDQQPPATTSALSLEARNVVDGQRLRANDREPGTSDPRPGDASTAAVVDRLVADLDDAVDALADLLLAESVHHLVGGNPLRAGLSADAIGRGDGVPQEIEVVRTPRSANAVAHHIGVLASASRAADPGGWNDNRRLAVLEPALEAWCRVRLGSPAGWRFGTADPGAAVATNEVGLDALGWCALDVISAARTGATSPLARALAGRAGDGRAVVTDDVRLGDLVLLCEQLRAAIAGGTALLPGHLDPADAEPWARVDLRDLHDRAAPWVGAILAARDALSGALDRGDASAITAQLAALADAGIAAAGAQAAGDDEDPVDRGRQMHAFLERAGIAPIAPPPTATADAEGWARGVASTVAAIAGNHLMLLPRLRVAPPSAADTPAGADHDAVADWLRNLSLARPGVAALADALAAGEILGSGPPGDFAVAQMPPQPPGTTWVATAPAVQDPRNPIGATIVLHHDGDLAGHDAIAGLVVDSFSEAIPVPGHAAAGGPQETVGAAFHHDRPGARAPQALLLAVPPDPERGWCKEDIHGVVEDTLWLARVRATDLDDLPELRQLFPLPAPD